MRLATNSSAGCAVSSSGAADLVQAAVADHADAIGERARVEEVVGDDQRGELQRRQDLRELFAHGGARVRVERGQRLVEQQHLRVAAERTGHRDALALAAGEPVRLLAREVPDVQALEQLAHARGVRAPERDVGRNRHVREERVLLEDQPDGAAVGRPVELARRVQPDVVAERDPSVRRPLQPRDVAQDRGLARPARPDERERLGADAQTGAELERTKGVGEVELERRHERSLYKSSTPALMTTSRMPIESATSKLASSCS